MEKEKKQIFSEIYQDLKEEMINNKRDIFVKEYTIPSVNYNLESKNRENMCFVNDIEMELYQMMKNFNYEVYFSSYKDKYFFSNSAVLAQEKMMSEISKEVIKENKLRKKGVNTMAKLEELKEKLFEKVEKELADFKQELRLKVPDVIMENAYKLTVMEGVIGELKERTFDKNELKALLKEDKLLEGFYEAWKNTDGKLCEVVQYPMEDTIDVIVQEYEQEKLKNIRESR